MRGWTARALLLLTAFAVSRPVPARAQAAGRPLAEARTPNLRGATGLLRASSAYVPRSGEVAAIFGGDEEHARGGLLVGIANRAEIGVSVRDGWGGTGANAKVNLLPETLIGPALSVGVVDAFGAKNGAGGYVVASKYLIPTFVTALTGREFGVKLHAGYGGGLYGHDLFAGAEVFPVGRVAALAEIVRGRVSLGARLYGRNDGWIATAGLFDFDDFGGSVSVTAALR